MNPWRMLLHGFQRIEDRRQLLVLDVNEGEGFFGDVRRLGRHGNDLFSDETDTVTGEDWDIEQETAKAYLRQISPNENRLDPRQLSGLRDSDGEDARVREGTAQTLPPQHSWQRDICGVKCTTGDFCRPFNVTCRLTDAD
jgi:hypothetical protein